jgi:hypothetical protein
MPHLPHPHRPIRGLFASVILAGMLLAVPAHASDCDADGVLDHLDTCPYVYNPAQDDTDGDGFGDACDKCPGIFDPAQPDLDFDGIGDACDPDEDGDGVADVVDNCPRIYNPGQEDGDFDGTGDVCEDADGDGVPDLVDRCPGVVDPTNLDTDGDGSGNACDSDDDGDGVPDVTDVCPLFGDAGQPDADGDLIGDFCDPDRDGDGIANESDLCPDVSSASDSDGDGLGDACDAVADTGWIFRGRQVHGRSTYAPSGEVAMATPGSEGQTIVAWVGIDFHSRVQKISLDGHLAWGSGGVQLSSEPGVDTDVALAPDGAGGAFVAWVHQAPGSGSPEILRMQKLDSNGTPLWTAGGIEITEGRDPIAYLSLAADGAGGVAAAWTESSCNGPTLFAQRLTGSGVPMWAAGGVSVMGGSSAFLSVPSIAALASGDLVVGVGGVLAGLPGVHVQRLAAGGTTVWPVPTRLATDYLAIPYFVPASDGGAFMAVRAPFGSSGVAAGKVFRVDAAGTEVAGWAGGVDPGGAAGSQTVSAAIAADGAGGVYVVFVDGPSPFTNTNVYAQRLDAAGLKLWGSQGVPVATSSAVRKWPDVLADGEGAIASWSEFMTGIGQVLRVQRLSPAGVRRWGAAGSLLSETPVGQVRPTLAPDGENGAIATWHDVVSGASSVRAQRVRFGGLTPHHRPALAEVQDIRPDEGGAVALAVSAGEADVNSFDPPLTGHNVWRRVAAAPVMAAGREPGEDEAATREAAALLLDRSRTESVILRRAEAAVLGFPPGDWQSLGFHSATGSGSYALVAATLADSAATGSADEEFVVTSHTGVGTMYDVSPSRTGHSTDDLAPAMPAPFTANYGSGSNSLNWGASGASDFASYDLHAGPDAAFVPNAGTRIATPSSPGYVHVTATQPYYKVATVDRHGNASLFALAGPPTTGVGDAAVVRELALSPARPNPARERVAIEFTLPRAAAVELAVFDLSGRVIRRLDRGTRDPGAHALDWNLTDDSGRRVQHGQYFLRLSVDSRTLVRRVLVVK